MIKIRFTYESEEDKSKMLKLLETEFRIKKVSKDYISEGVSHKRGYADLEVRA